VEKRTSGETSCISPCYYARQELSGPMTGGHNITERAYTSCDHKLHKYHAAINIEYPAHTLDLATRFAPSQVVVVLQKCRSNQSDRSWVCYKSVTPTSQDGCQGGLTGVPSMLGLLSIPKTYSSGLYYLKGGEPRTHMYNLSDL